MKTWVECRGFDKIGVLLCSELNEALSKMRERAQVINVSINTTPGACEHEDPQTLVYFILQEKES